MNTLFGRHVSALSERRDRMESELTRWLVGLEPVGTPVALRLRTFVDLRDEAARPRPRLSWLRPALSAMASLGSVVAGAGLVALLISIGIGVDAGGANAGALGGSLPGMGHVTPRTGDYQFGPDPVAVLSLIVASVIAGFSVMLPWAGRVFRRIAFGKGATAPAALLPLRRSWRTVSPAAWALGAIAVVFTACECRGILTAPQDTSTLLDSLDSFATSVASVVIPLVVAWRYPLGDRSTRLLLVGTVGSIAGMLFYGTLSVLGISGPVGEPAIALWGFVWLPATIALAAGIVGRSGMLRRPPLRLTVAGAGFAFSMTTAMIFFYGLWNTPLFDAADNVAGALEGWIEIVAWMAILWVGIGATRKARDSWGWKLVVTAGVLHLLSLLPDNLLNVYQYLNPYALMTGPLDLWLRNSDGTVTVISPWFSWDMVTTIASQWALVLALVIGLRQVLPAKPPDEEPATATSSDERLADDGSPSHEPEKEVAGEMPATETR